MNQYLRFSLTIIMPIAATILFVVLERYTKFGKLKSLTKQIIIGIVFSATAVFATEWGFESELSVINVRDASPICAGFIFGPISGIVSGVVGGVHRILIAVLLGKGAYSAIACSVSTVVIGFVAAIFCRIKESRQVMLFSSVLFTIVAESSHLLMIFFTNLNDINTAYKVVSACIPPIIGLTTLTVAVSVVCSALIKGTFRELFITKSQRGVSGVMERLLVAGLFIAYIFTGFSIYIMQTNASVSRSNDTISSQLTYFQEKLRNTTDFEIKREMIEILFFREEDIPVLTDLRKKDIPDSNKDGKIDSRDITEHLKAYALIYGYDDLNLVSADNKILYSSNYKKIGDKITDKTIQEKLKNGSFAEPTILKGNKLAYAGTQIGEGNSALFSDASYMLISYDENKINETIRNSLYSSSESFHFGNAGTTLVLEKNPKSKKEYTVVKSLDEDFNTDIPDTVEFFDPTATQPNELTEVEFQGKKNFMIYKEENNLYYVTLLNKELAMLGGNISITITMLMEVVISGFVSLILYIGIRRNIIRNIKTINSNLGEICDGNLDVTVNVRANKEFSELSDDINSTVDTLKRYIEAEARRINDELALAHSIQTSSLPRVFPPYPNHNEFDIYAAMNPAKEVGGDFYDFFMIENMLTFVIADVSGKGIPAALFMMTSRTTLKQLALQGKPIDEVFEIANRQLYETNPSRMFVTAWMGTLNINTGELRYVNAGHNPPLLYRDGKCEYLKGRTGFVLAGMKNTRYEYKTIFLSPEDRILLYTDGVTEAMDKRQRFYGEERLQELVNKIGCADVKEICEGVCGDVGKFAEGCVQADDLTVLSVCYHGSDKTLVEKRTFPAEPQSTAQALKFVEDVLTSQHHSPQLISKYQICTDEIISNIIKFSYQEKKGDITVGIELYPDRTLIEFIDSGTPFNPLDFENSEINIPAKQRKPGGLGIFLVKKLMDKVEYSYENGDNHLRLTKNNE